MSPRKNNYIFIVIVLLPVFCIAQTSRIDSLKKTIASLTDKTEKLDALISLCKEQSSLAPDSIYLYAVTAKQLALTLQDPLKTALADYYIASYYSTRGLNDSSLAIINNYLSKLTYNADQKTVYVNFTLLKSRILDHSNKPKEGLDFLYPLLVEAENQLDTLTQVRTTNGMAAAFVAMGDDKEAQKWCFKALTLYPRSLPIVYRESYGVTLNNLALTYIHLYDGDPQKVDKKNLDSSEYYADKAIIINRQEELLGSLAYGISLKATVLGYAQKYEEGEKMLLESLAIYRRIGNMFYIINTMSIMGYFYGITHQPQKGIAICKEGIELSKKTQPNIYLYENLAFNYKLAGDYKHFGETMEQFTAIKDSLHKKNSAAALSEVQGKYEMQKKENTIIQQNYALSKKNYIAYGSFALLFLGGGFSLILFRQNKRKQQLKMQLIQEEEKRRSEIAVSTAEEKERNRIAAELHDNLGGQLSYISSNMDFILEAPAIMTEDEKKNHLTKVNETAKSTIADLRESIWALKKQQVEIDELADKLKLYAQHQLAHQKDMQLEVKENISHKSVISSAEALNIFRIFQEAINNASRYSAASTIVLSVETNALHLYKIAVADNGKGFDTSATFKDHYGLENMQQRSKDIHADLYIESIILSGTTVSLIKNIV